MKPLITFEQKGDFKKTYKYFNKLRSQTIFNMLDQYGKEGLSLLARNTPRDTGRTAESWTYQVTVEKGGSSIVWSNSNVQNGVSIAVILQYGHATKNGGWVEGKDYINPALQPLFDEIVDKAWKEVTSL